MIYFDNWYCYLNVLSITEVVLLGIYFYLIYNPNLQIYWRHSDIIR